MSRQYQFLNVVDRDTAERRFRAAIATQPVGETETELDHSLGCVLAEDVYSPVNVPSFDRSNFDGYAVRAEDTFGAREEAPRRLQLLPEVIATAVQPQTEVKPGQAMAIATGGMIPRGADAIVMIEDTDIDQPESAGSDVASQEQLLVRRAVTSGRGIAFAGVDIAAGELVLRRGEILTSRETGVLAAIGASRVMTRRRPRVGVVSTGDEIIAPTESMQPGLVYDSNARILCDAIEEAGGTPISLGIVRDDRAALREVLNHALLECDLVLLSGGTSKGAGDLCYHVVAELDDPGIVAHGVALKPGKPICLAAQAGKGVVVLPGFPTSAIFTFHEFVAPLIRQLAGQSNRPSGRAQAEMAVRVNSEVGRTEFLLVSLAQSFTGAGMNDNEMTRALTAYPMGKGSGSVTTFSKAEGFIVIPRDQEMLEAGAPVEVTLLGRELVLADLNVIGSHCVGLDMLLSEMESRGFRVKNLNVGSTAGLLAAKRGECDIAGMHLLDVKSGQYNLPMMDESVQLIPGYGRMQSIVFRPDDERFQGRTLDQLRQVVLEDPSLLMVNRNQGSGTRALIDDWLDGEQPAGYANQSRSHHAVAAAVSQGRADWGVAIEIAAQRAGLSSVPLAEEQYDFVAPANRMTRPAVMAFCELLQDANVRERLQTLGFDPRD